MVKTPQRLNAGESLDWVASFSSYPASEGWSLSFALTNEANSYGAEFEVSPLGDDFAVKVTPTSSTSFVPGSYTLFAVIEKGDTRKTVSETPFTVKPSVTQTHDRRSQAERTLQAIDDLLEGKADDDQQMIQYNGRTLSRYTFEQLLTIRGFLARKVARERSRKNGVKPRIGVTLR